MTFDEIRDLLNNHFERSMAKHRYRVTLLGPRPEEELETYEKTVRLFDRGEAVPEWGAGALADLITDRNLAMEVGAPDHAQLKAEHRIALRNYYQFLVDHDRAAKHDRAALPESPSESSRPHVAGAILLAELAREFSIFNVKQGLWSDSTAKERERHFGLLVEMLGSEKQAEDVSAEDARGVRGKLLDMPANRNKKKATRDLAITDQLEVAGTPKMQRRTINKHLHTYNGLFAWAAQEGRIAGNPFVGVRLAANSRALEGHDRQAFSKVQLEAILAELTEEGSERTLKDHQKWGSLIELPPV